MSEITGDSLADRAAELLLQDREVNQPGLRLLAQKYTDLRAQLAEAQARLAEIERQEPVGFTHPNSPGGVQFYKPLPALTKLYADPVAPASQSVADDVVRDAERLDFLISEGASVMKHQREGSPACYWLRWELDESKQVDAYQSPREAIDAAMRDASLLAAAKKEGK